MDRTQLLLGTLLAIVWSVVCEVTPRAGKCHQICMDPYPLDFTALALLGKYDILYATNFHFYRELQDEEKTVSPVTEGIFRVDDVRTFPNGSTNRYTYTVSYVDNIAIEETVDEQGERHQFRDIPLAVTKENAILYYRCSDTGSPNIDTRVIIIPKGKTLSEEGLQYLMDIDKKCNFKGTLKKIPKGLQKKL